MSSIVDTLITKYVMDRDSYAQGANDVVAMTNKVKEAWDAGLGVLKVFGGAVMAVGGALATLSVYSGRQAAEFDALVRALNAVEGSADSAKTRMKELAEVAKLPGLGFEEAIQGYLQLTRGGMSGDQAVRALLAGGNANALMGGGRAELEPIMRAFMQMSLTGNVQGNDLLQLSNAGIPAQKILQEKYGTFDGGKLSGKGVTGAMAVETIIQALEKMPKAGDSAKNAIENVEMALRMAVIGIGDGVNAHLLPIVKSAGEALGKLTDAGVFQDFGDTLGTLIESVLPRGITEVDGMTSAMIDAMSAAVGAGAAIRNMTMNISDIIEWVRSTDPAYAAKKKMWDTIFGGAPTPMDEASSWADSEKARIALRNKQLEKERGDNGKAKDAAADLDKASNSPTLPYLERIATATEKMADFTAGTIGGSVYGDRAFNTVNLSKMGGRGGGKAQRVVSLLEGLISESTMAGLSAAGVTR